MRITSKPGSLLSAVALVCLLASPGTYAQDSNAELLAKLEFLQQQIDELKQQLEKTQNQAVETDAKVEAVAEVMETGSMQATESRKTTIAGYGELHYNNLSAQDPVHDVDMIDFHRFVLFFGHQFNDKTRFYSEFELEHSLAGDGAPGEVELEQAFIEFDLQPGLHARAGLFLIPVGLINETHEPPTFYGVERNNVESIIVPSTWWERCRYEWPPGCRLGLGCGCNLRFTDGYNWKQCLPCPKWSSKSCQSTRQRWRNNRTFALHGYFGFASGGNSPVPV